MRFQRQRSLGGGFLNLSSTAARIGVAAGAIAVIGVCGFLIWRGLIREQPAPPRHVAKTIMECEKCHERKEFSDDEISKMGRTQFRGIRMYGMDCPKCGGQKTMKLTVECPAPSCHYNYLPPVGVDCVCPKCGADYMQAKLANP